MYPDEGILKVCTKCNLVYYCGRKCQKDAWKSHHKLECEYLENMPSEMDVAFNGADNLPNEDGVHEIQMIFLNVLRTEREQRSRSMESDWHFCKSEVL